MASGSGDAMSPEELKALEDYYAENPEPTERDIDAEYREHMARAGSVTFTDHGVYVDGVPLRVGITAQCGQEAARASTGPPIAPMDAKERYHGPACRCGSRNTMRIGESALMRMCLNCGRTFSYRLHDGILIPLGLETAQAWDEERSR